MLLTNYHTHCNFCDGAGKPEEYIQRAITLGFDAIGFSSHGPISFEQDWTIAEERLPEYLALLESLKIKYKDEIEVYKGLEIDYLEGLSGPSSARYTNLQLDYIIGSVHMIPLKHSNKFLAIDGPVSDLNELLSCTFDGKIEDLSDKYYSLVRDMLTNHKFNIIGHLDLIKKRNSKNQFFSEDALWYKNQVFKTLDTLAHSGVILEVNTGGLSRGAIDSVYPSPWIIKEAAKRKIPLMLNADAHRPAHIDYYFKESVNIIKECGYDELISLYDNKWVSSKI